MSRRIKGSLKLKVKILRDDRKTPYEITRDIYVEKKEIAVRCENTTIYRNVRCTLVKKIGLQQLILHCYT